VLWREQKPEYFHELSDQWTYDIIQVNIKGTIRMTRTIVPFMLKQGKGGIINVSSGSGTHPTPMITMYAASKVRATTITWPDRPPTTQAWLAAMQRHKPGCHL
jgi:short-subunit dehydrogenase